ncbi:hypothetical protein H8B15_16940 [Hymenobacter sp. BT507]|uniref:Uncharacterized protein n=1 Tax=Hymenobacter citatus TaxID=2763506 RepID=A0ABR7MNG5_9BACT|nr:hypothetical protein [Hymenobacter citatus]MBC6612611.1 hypothetical protein [Hymenobacter citatus]
MKFQTLQTAITTFINPIVAGLDYRIKTRKLIIYYHSNGDEDVDYQIVFNNPRGFKLLDERDMINYWEVLWKTKLLPENALFEVRSGGWLDMEDDAGGFTSKLLECREFLITGADDCVSVLSFTEPEIRPCLA